MIKGDVVLELVTESEFPVLVIYRFGAFMSRQVSGYYSQDVGSACLRETDTNTLHTKEVVSSRGTMEN